MITIETIYYVVAIVGILCSAAYKLRYEDGKNARKLPPRQRNIGYFLVLTRFN